MVALAVNTVHCGDRDGIRERLRSMEKPADIINDTRLVYGVLVLNTILQTIEKNLVVLLAYHVPAHMTSPLYSMKHFKVTWARTPKTVYSFPYGKPTRRGYNDT